MEQIIIDDGYVVQSKFVLPPDTYGKWHSMKNFGDRQSDAIEYKKDIGGMETFRLVHIAKLYNKNEKWIRRGPRKFEKQRL